MTTTTQTITREKVDFEAHDWSEWPQLSSRWRNVAEHSPYASFFLQPEWVASWLDVFGGLLKPQVVFFVADGNDVGCCVLVRKVRRVGPVKLREVFLNTAGENEHDSPWIEYNDLLCLEGWEEAVARSLNDGLDGWDHFYLSGVTRSKATAALRRVFHSPHEWLLEKQAFYVDLDAIRAEGNGYLSTLSSNTRSQVRRSRRLYEKKTGAIDVELAEDATDALRMLDDLAELHQQKWVARGEPGVFASDLFMRFHQALVARKWPSGGIQLMRVRCGEKTVGILYNFVWKGKVHYYQSGFSYAQDNRLKPGLVSHAAAVEFCLGKDFDEYDFMAGDSRYKRSLASNTRSLCWIVVKRPGPRSTLLEMLARFKRGVSRG